MHITSSYRAGSKAPFSNTEKTRSKPGICSSIASVAKLAFTSVKSLGRYAFYGLASLYGRIKKPFSSLYPHTILSYFKETPGVNQYKGDLSDGEKSKLTTNRTLNTLSIFF